MGTISRQRLTEIEDAEILRVIEFQKSTGLQSITDGEFRREMWHTDFLTGFDGIKLTNSNYAVKFQGKDGQTAETRSMLAVTDKVHRSKPIMINHFRFLKRATTKVAKFCIPSPTYLHMRGGRHLIASSAYSDIQEFWADITSAYQAEISDLDAAGCTYLQLDDVSFAYLCDPNIRDQIKADGEDPDRLPSLYVDIVNGLLAKIPDRMSITMHTCRGNHQSMWMASGGYDAVAETLFNTARVNGFFLEYDTDRAGGFAPLRFVPKGKKVVLGLVSSKDPRIETQDELQRRIDLAAKYIPLEQLCLSPQCGFASTSAGNLVTEDITKRKLELIVMVATKVWGSAI